VQGLAQLWKVREAFGFFGAVPSNHQWAWSARSPDGKTVVVNWWKDEVRSRDGKLIYDMRNHPHIDLWRDRRGNRDRIKNLAHARDYCDGLFRIVWIKTNDPSERVRKTVERYPDKTLWMRLSAPTLNEHTGEFLAEEVEHA
jgi:hypothetical protein